MRIVIFGLAVSSSWGNGHAALWRGLIRALHGAGHEVIFFERNVPNYAEHRDLTELPGGGELAGAMYPSDFPWSDNIYFVRHLPPAEHNALYASSRLTLNVTRAAMAASGWCPSGRLFEAAACGVPLLSDAWPGLEDFLTPGSEILVAETADDVLDAIDQPDADLRALAKRARERTLDHHTADQRAKEMIACFEAAMTSQAA